MAQYTAPTFSVMLALPFSHGESEEIARVPGTTDGGDGDTVLPVPLSCTVLTDDGGTLTVEVDDDQTVPSDWSTLP